MVAYSPLESGWFLQELCESTRAPRLDVIIILLEYADKEFIHRAHVVASARGYSEIVKLLDDKLRSVEEITK